MKAKSIQLIGAVAVAFSLVACGQGMDSKSYMTSGNLGGGENGSLDTRDEGNYAPVPFDAQKLAADVEAESHNMVDQTEAAAEEAEAYLNRIKLGGGNLEIESPGASQQLILDKAIAKVLDRIYQKLQQSPQLFAALRAKVADSIARLDSSNPLHQAAIAALMVAIEKMDPLEAAFQSLLGQLSGAMDVVISRLEVLVGAVPFPASILVAIEWADVKRVLQDFQNKLENL